MTKNGVDFSQGIAAADTQFFAAAVNAIATIGNYGSPFFAPLKAFEHVQSTGLQIARAAGKTRVYFGFAFPGVNIFLSGLHSCREL
ncbi:MAG: cytochrome c biogenesis protein ResB [Pseudomonadota bacterium]